MYTPNLFLWNTPFSIFGTSSCLGTYLNLLFYPGFLLRGSEGLSLKPRWLLILGKTPLVLHNYESAPSSAFPMCRGTTDGAYCLRIYSTRGCWKPEGFPPKINPRAAWCQLPTAPPPHTHGSPAPPPVLPQLSRLRRVLPGTPPRPWLSPAPHTADPSTRRRRHLWRPR